MSSSNVVPVFESSGCNGNVRVLEQRDFLLRWAKRLACVLLLAAVSYGSWCGYRSWRQQHLARQTQEFVTRGDYKSAVLVARRLLELDADNLAACRAMAEMAEQSGKADAVTWRTRVAHLDPNVADNQLRLAKSALQFGQKDLADHVLKALPEAERASAIYHQLAGALALAESNSAEAEQHFSAALQGEPSNVQLALNLAIIQLGSGDGNKAYAARASLAELTANAEFRGAALRALSADALARKDADGARRWTTELHNVSGATFADALLYFQAVEGTEAAAPALADLQAKAATSPASAAELITWLNRHGMAVVAIGWAMGLPKEILEVQPVPLAVAEAYSFTQDWPALQTWVEGKNWGEFEAMRLAVESHAMHRLTPADRDSMQTQTVWRAALKAAQTRPAQLLAIAQLVEGWGYRAEAEEAWWTIANSNDNAKVGLTALQRLYKAQQDTRGMLRVAKRALELNPLDLVAANNCASLGLLLTGDSTSRRLAAKLHQEHPANRAFAATHAYALHTEGKLDDALKVMESFKEEELQYPAVAAYYVVMLTDGGKLDRARPYLANAQRAALLPEEQRLLAAATQKLLAAESDARANGVALK